MKGFWLGGGGRESLGGVVVGSFLEAGVLDSKVMFALRQSIEIHFTFICTGTRYVCPMSLTGRMLISVLFQL